MATLAEEYEDLYDAKKEVADAITDVGEKFGIKANEADSFRSYADKILKIGNSIWSSAEDSEEQHLLITENGYYDVNDLSKKYFDDADKYSAVSSLWISVQSAPVIVGKRNIYVGESSEITVSRPEPLVKGSDYASYDAFLDALTLALNATKTIITISYSDFYRIECPNGAVFFSYVVPGRWDQCPGPFPTGKFINNSVEYTDLEVYGDQYTLIFMTSDGSGGLAMYADAIGVNKGSTFEKTYYSLYVDDDYGVDIHNSFWDYWVLANHSSYRLGRNTLYSTVYYSYDKQYGKSMGDALASKFEIGHGYQGDGCPPSVGITVDLDDFALYLSDYWAVHDHKKIDTCQGLSIDGVQFAHIGAGLFKRVT